MKKFVVSIVLLLLLPTQVLAAIPQKPSYNSYVYDYQQVIDDEMEQKLIQAAKALEGSTGNVVVMMTIDTIGGLAPYEFGVETIREWGIGDAELNNGMLIFATTNQGAGQNDVWIAVGDGLEGDYPDGKLGQMVDDYMMPYLANGDYTNAFASIFSQLYEEMGGDASGAELVTPTATEDEGISIGFIIFIVILYFLLTKFGGGGPGGRRRTAGRAYRTGGFSGFGGGSGRSSGGFGGFGGGGSSGGGAGRKF